jgi:ABC-type glycerol-3-phosphate transport system substrate-binding protein
VRDLRAAWKERSGAELSVTETGADALAKSEKADADIILYPSPLIGDLAQRRWLAALPAETLKSDELSWSDLFEALRDREATWDVRTVAVPLGSRVLACFYRADLFARLNQEPPETWSDYQALVDFFSDRSRLDDLETPNQGPWAATSEPLAKGWAGLTLLARAASYAKHRDYFTVLFDSRTMAPRIDGPPFARALEELVAASRGNHERVLKLAPVDAVNELLAGRCALALGWPVSRHETEEKAALKPSAVRCALLPGSREAFVWDKGRYEPGALRRVPLLACEGRMASVAAAAQHPTAATQLLFALTSGDWGVRVSSASLATAPFRRSQLADAERWSAAGSATAGEYGRAVADSLSTQEVVYALRIPGREEYLAALDEAVRTAVTGRAKPGEALQAAAARWQEITSKHGIDSQRKACEQSDVRVAF